MRINIYLTEIEKTVGMTYVLKEFVQLVSEQYSIKTIYMNNDNTHMEMLVEKLKYVPVPKEAEDETP